MNNTSQEVSSLCLFVFDNSATFYKNVTCFRYFIDAVRHEQNTDKKMAAVWMNGASYEFIATFQMNENEITRPVNGAVELECQQT